MSTIRNKNTTFPINSVIFEHLKFFKKSFWVNNHTRTKKNRLFRIKNSRRNLMECIFFAVNNNCVTSICTTGKTNYIFSILCKIIYNFTFTFITPLGTHNYYVHGNFLVAESSRLKKEKLQSYKLQ